MVGRVYSEEVSMGKEDRGFASMDHVKQREIASKGGKAAHQKGTAHEWTSEEAREAGRKGGMASWRHRKAMMDPPQGAGSDTTERAGGDEQPSALTDGPAARRAAEQEGGEDLSLPSLEEGSGDTAA